jgi:hypothetical protein
MKKHFEKLLDHITKILAARVIQQLHLDRLHITVLDIQPGDILVVKSNQIMHAAARQAVMDRMEGLFPQNLTIVMDQLDLSLIRPKVRMGNNAR